MATFLPAVPSELHINTFFQQLTSQPSTRNRYRALLKHFLTWAKLYDGELPSGLKMERELNQRSMRVPEDKKLELELHLMYAGLLDLYIASIDTGLRRGALCQLRLRDVDFANKMLKVAGKFQKTGKAQRIPLTARLCAILEKKTGPGVLFEWNQKEWDFIRKTLKLEDLHWHDLRHEFGLRLLEKKVPLPTIKRLLGHSQITTTMRYLNTENTEDADRAAIGCL